MQGLPEPSGGTSGGHASAAYAGARNETQHDEPNDDGGNVRHATKRINDGRARPSYLDLAPHESVLGDASACYASSTAIAGGDDDHSIA